MRLLPRHPSQGHDVVKPEYTYGDPRLDFYMESHGEKYLTEVKGCTLAANLKRGMSLFPDAPTQTQDGRQTSAPDE